MANEMTTHERFKRMYEHRDADRYGIGVRPLIMNKLK